MGIDTGLDDAAPAAVLKARRLFDGHKFVEPAILAIAGGQVAAVGSAVMAPVTDDLGEVTVLPGLVDCHQHLVFDGNGRLEEQVAGRTDSELEARARMSARRALEGGITTLRDLGDRNYVTLSLRGDPDLPTILCSGPPLTSVHGHCWYLGGECVDREALVAGVGERIERGCDVIKIMATGGFGTPAAPPWKSQFVLDELRLVVNEAHRSGLPVAAHCHGDSGISDSIDAGVDTIEHCMFLNEAMEPNPDRVLLERLAASDIVLSATFGRCPDAPLYPPRLETVILPKVRTAIASVHSLGGRIVVGSDAGINSGKPHDVTPHAIHNLLAIGMTTVEALRAMTSAGADAIGLPAKGRLAPGADADLIAVGGDPRTDPGSLADIVQVWKSGRPVRNCRL